MKYCCVPLCTSTDGGHEKISFHAFPSKVELKAAWIKAISREGDKRGSLWTPSNHSVVCYKHFAPTDFSVSTKNRRLLPNTIPSVFPSYPVHKLQESSQKRRKPPTPRNEEPSVKKRRLDIENSDTCVSNTDADLFDKNDGMQSHVQMYTPVSRANDVGSAKSKAIAAKLHKRLRALRKINSQLRSKIKSLNNEISCLKSNKKKESFEEKQLKKIMLQKEENKLPAVMLFDQITNFGKKKITASSTALKLYILWQKRSPNGYEFVRDMKIFALPHRNTLKKYLGYSTGETGITSLIQLRLHHEFKNLQHPEEKMGSLIIDEMAIKAKLIYDRKLDLYLGNANADIDDLGIGDRLANHLLSFLFKGLSSNYRIPVAYFFTNQLTGEELYKLSKHVIENVEKIGFNVLRISTDNSKVNVSLFNYLAEGCAKPMVQHPLDPSRTLFLSFDPCHIIKNVRSQFLERNFNFNGKVINSLPLRTLFRLQKDDVVKPVRFLTRKHLFPNNLDKMNVKRAIQIFSKSVTASLETALKVDPHAFKDHDNVIATVHFMKMFRRWFEILNVSNRTHGYHSRNDALLAFLSESDERLDWLQYEFLPFIESVQAAATNKTEGFSSETFHALKITTLSSVSCIKYLLQNGFHYVLTDKFSSDDIEGFFSHLRQMGGANDAMDSRSCLHAIETTLKTGIIHASIHGNTECANKENLIQIPSLVNVTSPVQANHHEFPADVMQILSQNITGTPVTMRRATLAVIAGFLIRVASERNACVDCMILWSSPRRPALHLQLITLQDDGGLKYPSDYFLDIVDLAAKFICAAMKHFKNRGIRAALENVLFPFFLEKFKCACNNSNLVKIITSKFINLMLDNIGKHITATKAPKGINFQHKPLNRKLLKF